MAKSDQKWLILFPYIFIDGKVAIVQQSNDILQNTSDDVNVFSRLVFFVGSGQNTGNVLHQH